MLTAINEKGCLINLLEILPMPGHYTCPACGGAVRLKNGAIKMPHFAHVSLATCARWSENESAQHLALKEALYHWFSGTAKVEIEKYLPKLLQTPDLLVADRLAIEVQCSKLALKRLWERTATYRKQGYQVLWLLGKDLWLGTHLSALTKNFLYFSWNRGFHLWELDLARKVLRLKYLIHENIHGQVVYLTEEFAFGQGDLLAVLRRPYEAQQLKSLSVSGDKGIEKYIKQQLYFKNPYWLRVQEIYYLSGRNLLTEKFNGPQWTPPGLSALTKILRQPLTLYQGKLALAEGETFSFCQLTGDVSSYYAGFQRYYAHHLQEKLYPPAFYSKIVPWTMTAKKFTGKKAIP